MKYDSQKNTLEGCIEKLLKEYDDQVKGKVMVCVIGIPGPVNVENNTAICPMIPSWKEVNGKAIMDQFGFKSIKLINDFIAAGYGVASLKDSEYSVFRECLNPGTINSEGVKIVLGPGTGLGEAMLFKNGLEYEPYPSEGGHGDFAVRSEEDFKLMQFAKTYIPTSKNIEN